MAYTKNLGRVKGEKGDLYLPQITYTNDGKINFNWDKIVDEASENSITTTFQAPVFIPEYDSESGICRFVPNMPVQINNEVITEDNVGERYAWSIKGDPGQDGKTKLNIEYTGKTYEQLLNELETRKNNGTIDQYFESSTLYMVKSQSNPTEEADVYAYDDKEEKLILIEGIDINQFYKKNETYNQSEIDNMFDIQQNYLQEIFNLLDIEDSQYELNDVTLTGTMLDDLLDEKLTAYVKLDDIQYVDVDGILYFTRRG